MAAGWDMLGSVIVTTVPFNLLDKALTALISWGIVKALPGRFAARFPRAEAVTGSD